jgi:hypothetical protein
LRWVLAETQQHLTPKPSSPASSGGVGRSSELGSSEGGGSIASEPLEPTLNKDRTKISTPAITKVERFTMNPFISHTFLSYTPHHSKTSPHFEP